LPHSSSRPDAPVTPVPQWVHDENLLDSARAGAQLFAVTDCGSCHTYDGSGKHAVGAPDLTAIGSLNHGIDFHIRHLKCPSCFVDGSPMPGYAWLGSKRLRQLAIFLEASRGTH
jgi:mono/diheme cytochrome c family protein